MKEIDLAILNDVLGANGPARPASYPYVLQGLYDNGDCAVETGGQGAYAGPRLPADVCAQYAKDKGYPVYKAGHRVFNEAKFGYRPDPYTPGQ